jgi:hypothetical protein
MNSDLLCMRAKERKSGGRRSNRERNKVLISASKSLTCNILV